MENRILEVCNLKKYYQTPRGVLHAVDDISFTIERQKTLGIVGESGCGKSTTGRCIMRLTDPTDGRLLFEGQDLMKLSNAQMRKKRREIQMIFQDPFSSLDPRRTVMQAIAEPLIKNKLVEGGRKAAEERVLEVMKVVGLAERLAHVYPHELDGGRRQRIGIARAVAMRPKFIVCDEPVSALDVSIQAQILNLLKDLQEDMGLTYMFITHDLAVVNHIADEIAVMYLGQIVEKAPCQELFDQPMHPYTNALIDAIPLPEIRPRRHNLLKGELSSPVDPPDACRFARRCPYATEQCSGSCPPLREITPGHFIACHRAGEL